MVYWCKVVECWSKDVKDIIELDLGCDYDCKNCDESLKMEVEVMKNGKIVKVFCSSSEAWNYIENQTDRETAKYTVLDYR